MLYTPDANTVVTIHLDAYKRNLEKITRFIGASVKVMAVVKGNAYGHGMIECARTALESGVSMLGVAFASEGVALREAGISAPVLVMGPESHNHLAVLVDNNLTIGLNSFEMFNALVKLIRSKKTSCGVHVKVDTGMGRIGIVPEAAFQLVKKAWGTHGISVEGIFTHFPSADEDRDLFSRNQIKTFKTLLDSLAQSKIRPEFAHMCNSAGTLKFPEAHLDLIRPGIMTYGLIPYPDSEKKLALEPVLSWKSRVTFIKDVSMGFSVSYGSTYVTKRPSRLATVPVGYAHGYNRLLSNRGKAIINGVTVPVAGRVCMDQTVFDVTDAGDVREDDQVILIGREGDARISVEDHAEIAGTISHEIVTGITSRNSRAIITAS